MEGGDEEFTEVLYNKCYGGYSFSKEAMREYYERTQKEPEDHDQGRGIPRTDQDMIEIVKRLGDKANGTHARIAIERIPKKYAKFFSIGEYDGYECVCIEYNRYKLHEIKAAVEASQSSELKGKIYEIKAALAAHEGQDGQELKGKIEAILAGRGDDDDDCADS